MLIDFKKLFTSSVLPYVHKTKEISAVMVGLAWFILGKLVVSRVIHVGPCDSRLNADCWRLTILRLCRIDLVQQLLRDLIFR